MYGMISYTASKAGLEGLTRYAAAEFASIGIRVNAISACAVKTNSLRYLQIPEKEINYYNKNMEKNIPLGRIARPDDITKVIAFLASDRSKRITGQIIKVDGGRSLTSSGYVHYKGIMNMNTRFEPDSQKAISWVTNLITSPFKKNKENFKNEDELVKFVEEKMKESFFSTKSSDAYSINIYKSVEISPKREVKNVDKVVVQAYIQRVEQHKTDKEVVPRTETKEQRSEKVEVVPYIQREEKHTTQKQVVPQTKVETKKIVKKVIQPIIKDVIQPVHIRIKPVLQEGVKPTIFKKDEVRAAINQGTKTQQTIVKETKVEKEVNAGVKVRESIVRSSVLPTDNKGVIVKKEIISTNTVGMGGAGVGVGLGLEGVEISQAISAEGIHKEIVAGTTVRQSVVRSSVLPTIDGGTKILKPIFGGVRQSSAISSAAAAGAGFGAEFSAGASSSQIGATTSTTTTHGVIDLGTTVHNTIDLGVVNTGASTIGTGAGAISSSALTLGQNAETVDLGITTEATGMGLDTGSSQVGLGGSGLAFTTSQVQGTSTNGLVMGLGGEGDNAIDVTYTTNSGDNAGLGAFGATTTTTSSQYGTIGASTTTTAHQYETTGATTTTTTTKTVKYTTTTGEPIVGASNVLNPIVNTTVKEPIITGSTMNYQIENTTV